MIIGYKVVDSNNKEYTEHVGGDVSMPFILSEGAALRILREAQDRHPNTKYSIKAVLDGDKGAGMHHNMSDVNKVVEQVLTVSMDYLSPRDIEVLDNTQSVLKAKNTWYVNIENGYPCDLGSLSIGAKEIIRAICNNETNYALVKFTVGGTANFYFDAAGANIGSGGTAVSHDMGNGDVLEGVTYEIDDDTMRVAPSKMKDAH
ncbi:hypothetical protein AB4254_10955 [Vibrio breoganii]